MGVGFLGNCCCDKDRCGLGFPDSVGPTAGTLQFSTAPNAPLTGPHNIGTISRTSLDRPIKAEVTIGQWTPQIRANGAGQFLYMAGLSIYLNWGLTSVYAPDPSSGFSIPLSVYFASGFGWGLGAPPWVNRAELILAAGYDQINPPSTPFTSFGWRGFPGRAFHRQTLPTGITNFDASGLYRVTINATTTILNPTAPPYHAGYLIDVETPFGNFSNVFMSIHGGQVSGQCAIRSSINYVLERVTLDSGYPIVQQAGSVPFTGHRLYAP